MADPFVVPDSVTWMEDDLHVAAAFPHDAPGPVPLLLLLDGNSMFLTAAEYARTVSLVTMGALPPLAVVGVWRSSATPMEYFSTRFRDFTPYVWTLPEPFADDNAMIQHGTGEAAAFVSLLVNRVLPRVRERHDISEVAIGGWSLSGLCAAWAWREHPDVFSHLISISPSLWWHEARIVDEGLPPRPGARAFISAGEREEGDLAAVWPQMFANAAQRDAAAMVRNAVAYGRLCRDAGVDADTVIFADEHHVTLVPASLSRGIHHLWATS